MPPMSPEEDDDTYEMPFGASATPDAGTGGLRIITEDKDANGHRGPVGVMVSAATTVKSKAQKGLLANDYDSD